MSETGQISIAVCVPLVQPGKVEANLAAMTPLLEQAAEQGAEIALFSEAGITGYDLGSLGVSAALTLEDPRLKTLDQAASRLNLAIVAGLHERTASAVHNTAVVFLPNGQRVIQRKQNVVDQERAAGYVTSDGQGIRCWQYRGVRFAILICADNGIPDVHGNLKHDGCQVVLAPTAGLGSAAHAFEPGDLLDPRRRQDYLNQMQSVCLPGQALLTAAAHQLTLAFCNQAGYRPAIDYFHPGHGFIIDHRGRLAALVPGQFVAAWLTPSVHVATVSCPTAPGSLRLDAI